MNKMIIKKPTFFLVEKGKNNNRETKMKPMEIIPPREFENITANIMIIIDVR